MIARISPDPFVWLVMSVDWLFELRCLGLVVITLLVCFVLWLFTRDEV